MPKVPPVVGTAAGAAAATKAEPPTVDRAALANLMTAANTAAEAREKLTVRKSSWVGAGLSRLSGATAKADRALVLARRAFEQELAKPLAQGDLRFRNNWTTHNNLLAARDAVYALYDLRGRAESDPTRAAALTAATASLQKAGLEHEIADFKSEAYQLTSRRGETDRATGPLSVANSIEVALTAARRAVEPALKQQASSVALPFNWHAESPPDSLL